MTSKEKHHKHPPMIRPISGNYHNQEWSIYGTTCGKIEAFFNNIREALIDHSLLYVDADHNGDVAGSIYQVKEKQFSSSSTRVWNDYDDKLSGFDFDAVFINGNHYRASQQIVILDPNKKDSLERRKDQLTNIRFIIKTSTDQVIFPFIKERMNEETVVLDVDKMPLLIDEISTILLNKQPKLKALVLAGGKSQRMGKDKSLLSYYEGKPQQLYMAEMCQSLGIETVISKSLDFGEKKLEGFPVIKDRMSEMGPFGAIISAFLFDPKAAWLVVACDLPFLTKEQLTLLIDKRNSSKVATTFKRKSQKFPEPLITIYEPKAYLRFLQMMALGYSCPRKVIINSDVEVIETKEEHFLSNINTMTERNEVLSKLKN